MVTPLRMIHTSPFLRLLLAWLLTGAALPCVAATEEEQRAQLRELKNTIETLRSELQSVKSDRDELLEALENSEKSIGELSTQAEKLKKELEEQQQELNKLRQRKQQLEEDKSAQQQHVGEHLNAAYRMGQQSNLRLLLNQQDPDLVARNLKYFDYLTRARTEKIGRYVAIITELSQIEPRIEDQTLRLRRNHEKLSDQRQKLVAEQGHRKSTLARLEAAIASKDQQLQQMERDRQRLEQVLQQVAQVMRDSQLPTSGGNFADYKGQLPWPTNGRVAHRFGSERVAGKVQWQGILINAEAGTPVKAIHHGRVVFSEYLRGHGLLLIIDHGTEFMSLYAHNQALYKEIGEWVDAGEVIASVGNTGGQASTGLYFELRHQGRPTDPQQWIKT